MLDSGKPSQRPTPAPSIGGFGGRTAATPPPPATSPFESFALQRPAGPTASTAPQQQQQAPPAPLNNNGASSFESIASRRATPAPAPGRPTLTTTQQQQQQQRASHVSTHSPLNGDGASSFESFSSRRAPPAAPVPTATPSPPPTYPSTPTKFGNTITNFFTKTATTAAFHPPPLSQQAQASGGTSNGGTSFEEYMSDEYNNDFFEFFKEPCPQFTELAATYERRKRSVVSTKSLLVDESNKNGMMMMYHPYHHHHHGQPASIGPGPPCAVTPTRALLGGGGDNEGVASQKSPSPAATSILNYKDVWKVEYNNDDNWEEESINYKDVWEVEYDDNDNWEEKSIDNYPWVDDRYNKSGNIMSVFSLEILYVPQDQKLIDEILLCGNIAITASTVLRPSDSFDTQLCIHRADTCQTSKRYLQP